MKTGFFLPGQNDDVIKLQTPHRCSHPIHPSKFGGRSLGAGAEWKVSSSLFDTKKGRRDFTIALTLSIFLANSAPKYHMPKMIINNNKNTMRRRIKWIFATGVSGFFWIIFPTYIEHPIMQVSWLCCIAHDAFCREESREDENSNCTWIERKNTQFITKLNLAMDIPHLATILSSTFDPNLREEAEKKLNEVRVSNLNCSFRKSFFFLTHTCRPIFAKNLISLLQLKKAYWSW